MPVDVTSCPLCSALCSENQHTLLDKRQDHGVVIFNHVCSNCGFVFQSPRMTDEELEKFYSESYRELYQGDQGPNQKDLLIQEQRAAHLVAFLRKCQVPPIHRHLDIGCSSGAFLLLMQKAFSSQSVGIEPGTAYREYARSNGLNVFASPDELLAAAPDQKVPIGFDFISMIHVLEHIHNPVEYLENLRQNFLTGDGWLLIEAPNLYGHDSFEIAHLVAFSEHTLRETLNRAGYRIHASYTHGKPRSKILPLYITLLAQADQTKPFHDDAACSAAKPVPEVNVLRKRKNAMLKRRILSRLFPGQAWTPITR